MPVFIKSGAEKASVTVPRLTKIRKGKASRFDKGDVERLRIERSIRSVKIAPATSPGHRTIIKQKIWDRPW